MKLVTLFMIATMLQVAASTRAQVTLKAKGTAFRTVLQQIGKQTGHDLIYVDQDLGLAQPVNLELKNASLDVALRQLFKEQPLQYDLKDGTIMVKRKDAVKTNLGEGFFAEIELQQNIRGRVVNEKGEPLVGASVYVLDDKGKRSSVQTKTDEQGYFELPEEELGKRIEVSFLGYATAKVLVSSGNMALSLKPLLAEVDEVEVVNTGYQSIPKERATGSFGFIDNKTLNQQVGTNILQRLDGMATGLLFDDKISRDRKTNISVRGLSTIHGPLDPLIVLDGYVYEGNISNINPNDIENVTILKDASAASIWGARAGNGVLILTSKQPQFNSSLQVNMNSLVQLGAKPDLHRIPQISSEDYIDFEEFLFDKGYFNNLITNTRNFPALTPAVELFQSRKTGAITPEEADRQLAILKGIDARTEYLKYMYETPILQQYALDLRGGADNLAWIISGTYDKVKSELAATNDKFNLRFDNTYRPIKNMEINVGAYYTRSNNHTGKMPYGSLSTSSRYYPYVRLADDNGLPQSFPFALRQSYIDTAGMGKLLDWNYYPLTNYMHEYTKVALDEIIANVGVRYKVFTGLNVDLRYQHQLQRSDSRQIQDKDSYTARDMINRFSQLDRETGIVKYIVPLGGILKKQDDRIGSYNLRMQLNYHKKLNNHEVSWIGGAEARQVRGTMEFSSMFGYNQDPLTISIVDMVNGYPDFVSGFDGYTGSGYAPSMRNTNNRYVSFYTNGSYIFDNKYTISSSIRNDGSNIFGLHVRDKWSPLWSAGLAWDVHQEDFYSLEWLPRLRLRSTFGISGNVDPSKTAKVVGTVTMGKFFPEFDVWNPNNPNLKWEKVTTLNLALDFALKQEWLSGSVDYYHKNGSDLYGQVNYDYTGWGAASTITRNTAETAGRGVDLTLRSQNLKSTDFDWQTRLIVSRNVSKTKRYDQANAQMMYGISKTGISIIPVEGYPLYSIAAFRWAGLDTNGNPQGYVDGAPSTNYSAITNESTTIGLGETGNLIYIGSALPIVHGALHNTFRFKRIALSFNLTYKLGHYFSKPTLSYDQLIRGAANTNRYNNGDYSKRWKHPGDEISTNVPSFIYPNSSSRDNFFLDAEINKLKADHLRFQHINLTYSFRDNMNRNIPLKGLEVYINATNLGLLWTANPENIDPENLVDAPSPLRIAFGFRTHL